MTNISVTIATLVRNREWILPDFLKHVESIDYPKNKLNLLFIVNDSSDASFDMLKEFEKHNSNNYNKIQIEIYNRNVPVDVRTHDVRSKHIYDHLAILRNFAMSKATTQKFLFIDSDILVPSNLLKNLLSHNKEIISSLIWNGHELYPNEPWKYPNIMSIHSYILKSPVYKHISNFYVKNAEKATEDKVIEVDLTGAVMLIDESIYKYAKYEYGINGEDAAFCENVKAMGYKIWCNVGLFSKHIMSQNQLN